MEQSVNPAKKTYKREVAICMLVYIGGFAVWGVHDPEAKEIMKFLAPFAFTFAAGAYALDWKAKQA